MNASPHRSPPPPVVRCAAERPRPARGAWWILGAPALALAATSVLAISGAPGDWIGAVWLLAVLWTIAASLVQALWAGFRHGDWSAFACADLPCNASAREDDHDWATRTGAFAYLRIRDGHEALMREGDRSLEDHGRTDTPG